MYFNKSVKKPTGTSSPGASSPKNPNVTIIDVEDIIQFPKTDANGVKMQGNFVLREGATMVQVYMTSSSIKPTYESEGNEDEVSLKHKFEGSHPGDSLEIAEFIQNWLGRNVVIIYGSCSDKSQRVLGTPCAGLQLKPSSQDDNEARKKMMVFEQFASTDKVPAFYEGTLSFTEPTPTGASVSVKKDTRYKVSALEKTAPIKFTDVAQPHGTIITLIGGGGTDPAVLATSAEEDTIKVFLEGGANWTALTNSVINLQVFKAGAKTMLFEVSRS